MAANLTPVFMRLPKQQAAALDRMAAESGRAKQHVVSALVAQALRAAPPQLSMGRVEVSSTREMPRDEVLTLPEVAALLRLEPDAIQTRAERGDLPGRRFGDAWRFSKLAVLAWLADGDTGAGPRKTANSVARAAAADG